MGNSLHRHPNREPQGRIIYQVLWDTVISGLHFLDPEDVRSLSLGAVWNFSKGPVLPWIGIRVWGTNGLSKCLGALGPKGFKPNYYTALSHLTWVLLAFNVPHCVEIQFSQRKSYLVRFFFSRITHGVSFLPSAITESMTATHGFSCLVALIGTDFELSALIVKLAGGGARGLHLHYPLALRRNHVFGVD